MEWRTTRNRVERGWEWMDVTKEWRKKRRERMKGGRRDGISKNTRNKPLGQRRLLLKRDFYYLFSDRKESHGNVCLMTSTCSESLPRVNGAWQLHTHTTKPYYTALWLHVY